MVLPPYNEFPLPVSQPQRDKLNEHFLLLQEWNERSGLISPHAIETAFAKHYCDSLFIAKFAFENLKRRPVFDIGTGGGFPGMIFAIMYPQVPITLFERKEKKQLFLEEAREKLGLTHVTLTPDPINQKLRGLVLARAVKPPLDLLKMFHRNFEIGTSVILNLGGETEKPRWPRYYREMAGQKYLLPLDCGHRQVFRLDRI